MIDLLIADAMSADVRVPTGYMTFADVGSTAANTDEISFRDVTSPINPDDYTVHCPASSGVTLSVSFPSV